MKKFLFCTALLLSVTGLLNCSARQVKSGQLPAQLSNTNVVEIPDRKVSNDLSEETVQNVRSLNKKAGSPRFGLVKAFYQLPVAFPGGALHTETYRSLFESYRTIHLQNLGTKPYAIVPMSPRQGEVLSKTVTQLLDAGVRLAEVSTADAVKIMQAEQRAIEGKKPFFPSQSLPSGVELLISIESGQGETGPVYLGRVIRSTDGELLALVSEPDYGVYALQPLVFKLVEQSLRHLQH